MHGVAHQALAKLLARAERASIRRGSERAIALTFSRASFPAYGALKIYEDKQQVHAALREAERAGAIRIEWHRAAGDDGQVKRVVLIDRDCLARTLRQRPLWENLQEAEARLAPWAERWRCVERVLSLWRGGRTFRGRGPADVVDVIDALRVLEHLHAHPDQDFVLRLLSVQLFRDSKRLERLWAVLDGLTAVPDAPARDRYELYAELGLLAHPQPFLIAGPGAIVRADGSRTVIGSPYLGFAPSSIVRFESDAPTPYLLTVENQTIFHELARGVAGPVNGTLLFTGGMPSPAWRRAYTVVLNGIGRETPIFHWGDIDRGGFRVARKLAQDVSAAGRHLIPWRMTSSPDEEVPSRPASAAHVDEMVRVANEIGWTEIARDLRVSQIFVEQEAFELRLPS
jgi:hypothetical protein